MNGATQSLALPADSSAPAEARRFVEACLAGRRLTGRTVRVLTLVASELATNAVQHGGPPLACALTLAEESARLEVRDAGLARPRLSDELAPDGARGRGLVLVESLATAWGIERHSDGSKTVWAEVAYDG